MDLIARGICLLLGVCIQVVVCIRSQVGMMEGDWLQQTCKLLQWIKRVYVGEQVAFSCGVG